MWLLKEWNAHYLLTSVLFCLKWFKAVHKKALQRKKDEISVNYENEAKGKWKQMGLVVRLAQKTCISWYPIHAWLGSYIM